MASFDLGSLISGSLKALDLERRLNEQVSLIVWDEVVGERVRAAAEPQFIKDGRLFVVTKSPVWANELTMFKSDMIERLNKRIGSTVIRDIIFKAGKVQPAKKSVKKPSRPAIEGITLTDEELERVRDAAEGAGEAKEDLVKLFEEALIYEKWKKACGWKPCKVCGALQEGESGLCPVCEI